MNWSSETIVAPRAWDIKRVYFYTSTFFLAVYVISQGTSYLMWLEIIPSLKQTLLYVATLLVLLVVRSALVVSGEKIKGSSFLAFLLLGSMLLVQMLSFSDIVDAGGREALLQTIAFTGVLAPVMWLIGEGIGQNWNQFQTNRFVHVVLWVSLLFLGVCVLFGVYEGFTRNGVPVLHFVKYLGGNRYIFNYLSLADAIVVAALLLLSIQRALATQVVVYIIGWVFLTVSYSRASLFMFAFVGFIFLWTRMSTRLRIGFTIIVVSLGFISAITVTSLEPSGNNIVLERMTILFLDPASDESINGRLIALRAGLSQLEEHWLLGEFMAEWWESGETGNYIHNWLSYWVCFGIAPFLLSLYLMYVALRKSWEYYSVKRIVGPLLFVIFAVSSVFIAKAYTWPLIWLALGMGSSLSFLKDENRVFVPLQSRHQ
jgi:hypothetical protein